MPIKNCKLGKNVKIPYPDLVNLYGCQIGNNSFIGPFVEIQKGVKIGKNCRIQSHTFICEGVAIEDNVFIGHGVMFTNDLMPGIGRKWKIQYTLVKKYVAIGSGATILPVTIGSNSLIGAGAVVTKNVKDFSVVVGNPAKVLRSLPKK
jgi:acetyltransferase-like isoleucine patch superfamily enzyme